jgi:uncharacterized membrane protein YdjX (TVP38/TMEM64 family)
MKGEANAGSWSSARRWLLLFSLVVAVIAFFVFDLQRFLKLEYLQEQREQLQRWVESNYLVCWLIFFVVYLAVSALSIPVGAPALSLLAGFLFDLVIGTVLVSFASTAGGALAFLASRYLFREAVERRFQRWLEAINRGLARDGVFYLLTLRLVPVVPFTATNLVMGLTRMRLWTFWWVSQLGMLPGTILYVNAGKQLGSIRSPSDVLSPAMLISLALLGLVPLMLKFALGWWRGPGPA